MSGTTGTAADTTNATSTSTDDATGTNGGNAGGEKQYTEAEVAGIVKSRLEQAQRKADGERKKIEEDAEAKQLAEKQEFKTLAEKRAERIVELEAETSTIATLTADNERLSAALSSYRDTLLTGATDAMKEACEGRDLPWQIEFLAKHVTKSNGHGGPPATPKSNGNVSREELIQQEIQAQRARR